MRHWMRAACGSAARAVRREGTGNVLESPERRVRPLRFSSQAARQCSTLLGSIPGTLAKTQRHGQNFSSSSQVPAISRYRVPRRRSLRRRFWTGRRYSRSVRREISRVGVDRDEVVDLVGGKWFSVRRWVTGLPASFTSRRRCGRSRRRSVRRIRTWRAGRVGGVSV